jgi:hypothetical protein
MAAVQVEGKTGFVNLQGGMAIAPQFQKVGSFSEGWAWVQVEDQYRYIDPNGKFMSL